MLLFLKKNDEDETERPAEDLTGTVASPRDFIPYHCHIDAHTLLTKNGELMQIIKIAGNARGVNYESDGGAGHTVREAIRSAIAESIGADNISVWIHTLRKRKPTGFSASYVEPFAAAMHKTWQARHRWKHQYYNEIYLTVLHEGQAAPLVEKTKLKNVMRIKRNRQYRHAFLDTAHAQLEQTVSSMLASLSRNYAAHRLSVAERLPEGRPGQSAFYSEPMEFLHTLVNLRTEAIPLPEADISDALASHRLTFGFNAMESRDDDGHKRFGAMLTLKQYREMPPEAVDGVLQLPLELIITQAFHFIPAKIALKQYREQKELFDVSGDDYSIMASGLAEMLQANHKRPTDYAYHQTSITVLADEYKQLDEEIVKTQEAFVKLGLITVREDIKLEECFWAQLPGNFEFIRRRDVIAAPKLAGFCRLNLFPDGQKAGNHWGDAAALIPTLLDTPYFFNFHHRDNGHSVLFDFNSFGDAAGNVLSHFLLTSALKYHGRMFVFDRRHSAHLLLDKLGGQYHHLETARGRRALNPFSLEATARNQSFLLAWCLSLIEPEFASDAARPMLHAALEKLYAEPPAARNLATLIGFIDDPALAKALSAYHGKGKLAGWFDGEAETLDLSRPLQGFNMDEAMNLGITVPLFSYLMHRIIAGLDGKPTIIVLHEAWDLIDNDFFAPRLESLLEMLTQNNVMVLFTTSDPQACVETHSFSAVMRHAATRLYVPDDVGFNYESEALGLSAHDARSLQRMDRQRGEFLLKQGNDHVALRVDLSSMDDIHAVLAGDIKNLIAAGGPFASLPKEA